MKISIIEVGMSSESNFMISTRIDATIQDGWTSFVAVFFPLVYGLVTLFQPRLHGRECTCHI